VIEAGAVDAFVFDELEQTSKVAGSVAGEGQAQDPLLADGDAVAEAFHRAVEGAFDAAEFVVDARDGAVEADAT
jgi:hypothetical protein